MISTKVAFYFRSPTSKKWKLVSLHDDAEAAWVASIEHKQAGDIWFPVVPADGEQVPAELTKRQQQNFRTTAPAAG